LAKEISDSSEDGIRAGLAEEVKQDTATAGLPGLPKPQGWEKKLLLVGQEDQEPLDGGERKDFDKKEGCREK